MGVNSRICAYLKYNSALTKSSLFNHALKEPLTNINVSFTIVLYLGSAVYLTMCPQKGRQTPGAPLCSLKSNFYDERTLLSELTNTYTGCERCWCGFLKLKKMVLKIYVGF